MTRESELAGKVAIVTGAGRLRGIGRATANVLARMGGRCSGDWNRSGSCDVPA